MTTGSSRTSGVIVGGGPVGLSLAVALSQWGVDADDAQHPDL